MKVKDTDGNPIPNLSKENGSVISTDSNAYRKRLAQIRQQRKIDNMEEKTNQMSNDLKELKSTMDTLIKLLQEK